MIHTLLLSLALSAVPIIRARAPVFNPQPGEYSSQQSITVTTTSTGSNIYCTTDGSTPRPAVTMKYTSPIVISVTQTLKCAAYRRDRKPSLITSGLYTINSESPYKSPSTLYAEAQATCTAFPLRHSGTCPTGATCSSSPTHYTHFFCDCAGPGVNTAPGADAGCVAGDNGNANPSNNSLDCTNPNAPCQTLGTAGTVFSRMPAGDSIAFCRGGAFTTADKVGLWNTQCSGSADPRVALNNTTCDIREYPTTWGTKAPVLRPSGTSPLFQNDSDNARTVSGVRILNLDMEGDGTGPESCILRGSFGMEIGTLAANDYFFCNNTIRGFRIGLYPNTNYSVDPLPPQPTRFQVWGNYFNLNGQDGIYGGGTDVWIDANRMIDNGGTTCGGGGQGHQWYPNATGVAPAGGGPTRFTNNEVRFDTVNCRTVILGAHGPRFDGFLVENNIFDAGNSNNGSCWLGGPTGDSGYNPYSPQWQRNFVFRGNWYRGAGWVGVVCSQCPGAIIENNVFISTANSTAGQMLVDVPDHSREVPALDDITSNVRIQNNTFYFEGAQGGRYAIASPAYNRDGPLVEEGDGFVITNNTIYYASGSGQCWRTDWSDWRYTVTNNACYNGSWDNTPPSTPITTNPSFTNAPTDFTPQASSPLLDAGSVGWKPDLDHYLTLRSTPPDIGAIERNGITYKTPSTLRSEAQSYCSIANFPIRSTGTKHYFCECSTGREDGCSQGNDGNDGLTPSTAKRTWSAVITAFNAMSAGDTIALCKGGLWNIPVTGDCTGNLINSSCSGTGNLADPTNTTTCDIRDYDATCGAGACTHKPVLYANGTGTTRIISVFNSTVNGGRVLNLEFRGINLGPRGGKCSISGQDCTVGGSDCPGEETCNGVWQASSGISNGSCGPSQMNRWFVCNNTFTNMRLGIVLGTNAATESRWNIWGNDFLLIDQHGILGGPGDYSKIDANYFDNCGGMRSHPTMGSQTHSIYITSPLSTYYHDVQVVNNEVMRTGAGGVPNRYCDSTILVGHDHFDGLNIENNIVDAGSGASAWCWGLDYRAAGSLPTSYLHTHIRRNLIKVGGSGIAHGQTAFPVIEDNIIYQYGNPGNTVHGIEIPTEAARGDDEYSTNATIRNNTIYMTGGVGGPWPSSAGIYIGIEGTGHVISNNTIYRTNGWCWATPLADSAYTVTNNACYGGASYDNTPADPHVVTANPLYTNPPIDFTPQAGSPLINAGSDISAYKALIDFTLRLRSKPPDIGAVERQ